MKFLALFSCSIFLMSCHSQERNSTSGHIDTAKLLNPSGEYDGIEKVWTNRNLMIFQKDYYDIILNEKEYRITGAINASKFLLDSSAIISKHKFYLLYSIGTSFNEIEEVVKLVKSAGITYYQVIDITLQPKPSEVLPIVTPTSVSTSDITSDSTFLKIKISHKKFFLYLFSDSLTTTNVKAVDGFISKNLYRINVGRVVVYNKSKDALTFSEIKPLLNLLKKNGLDKFSMMTDQE